MSLALGLGGPQSPVLRRKACCDGKLGGPLRVTVNPKRLAVLSRTRLHNGCKGLGKIQHLEPRKTV